MENPLETKKDPIQDLESLFPVVITASLFFLTIIDILFTYGKSTPNQIGIIELQWANMPVAFIISYVLFRIFRKKYRNWILKTINGLLLAELVLIAIAVTVVIINGNDIHSYWALYALKTSLWCAGTVPTAVLLLLGIGTFFKEKKHASCDN